MDSNTEILMKSYKYNYMGMVKFIEKISGSYYILTINNRIIIIKKNDFDSVLINDNSIKQNILKNLAQLGYAIFEEYQQYDNSQITFIEKFQGICYIFEINNSDMDKGIFIISNEHIQSVEGIEFDKLN